MRVVLVIADVVVAINGVWILVETYTLNSKICPSITDTWMEKRTALEDLRCVCSFLQVDFPGLDLFPGVTSSSLPVSESNQTQSCWLDSDSDSYFIVPGSTLNPI